MTNTQGALMNSLTRNAGQVRKERAEMINRGGEKYYRRKIEDLKSDKEELVAARDAALDMSPSDINKIVTAASFNAEEFCEKDMQMTMQIREITVKLEEFEKRYEFLFGQPVGTAPAAEASSTSA